MSNKASVPLIWAALLLANAVIWIALVKCAAGAELEDCRGGCVEAVVRNIPVAARRPYSKENLTAFSYTQSFIPPLRYDFPYPGKYTVTRVNDKEMRLVCPLPDKGNVTLACAHLNDNCHIYMLNDSWLKAMGWNYDIVLRHELAHCNGWPWTHPGIEKPVPD